jgi:flagellin-like hook-associated protein FlgL
MSDKIDWEWGDNKPDAFIAERLAMQAEIERLRAEIARLFKEAYDEIQRLKAQRSATDGPTGAPAEKTIPASLDQTSGCSTPPRASTGYREF